MLINVERKAVEHEYNVNKLKQSTQANHIEEAKTELNEINFSINEIINKYLKEKSEIESHAITLRLKYTIFLGELLRKNMKNN
jgi:hypothetical protein